MSVVSFLGRTGIVVAVTFLLMGCSQRGTMVAPGASPLAAGLNPAGAAPIRAVTLLPTHRPMRVTPAPLPSSLRPAAPSAPLPSPGAASSELKVMTFNLRVATALDLHNTWAMRRGMVVERIREFGPDLLGTQEGLRGQTDYLRERLGEYSFFGAGRSDGEHRGEMCGIFYRKDRFEQIDGGHFWLSKNPQKPGSKAWGAWFPRMVTWVKLRPRDGSEQAIVFVNTHLDAFSRRARVEGAKLLMQRMQEIAGSAPCIVTGDFNADEGSAPYVQLTRAMSAGKALLVDAFRAANPTEQRGEGTRHGFHGGRGGERIDWILASPCFQALSASIDHSRGLLGYPSDHYPVTATLRLVAAPPPAPMAQIE